MRDRDALKDDAKTIKTKKIESNDSTNDDETLWINSVNKLSSKWIMKQSSFFKSVLDIIVIFFNVDENHDEIDDDANKDSETLNDDVNENDDEARSKEKSTKITSRFFFSSTESNIFERKRTMKFDLRFFFSFCQQ